MGDLVLGIDVGTSSCKTLVVESDGPVIDSARYEYAVHSPRYGWAEQDPEDWFNAFRSGLKDILERHPDAAKRISAIGVTGQMIGLTILDKSGSVVRPAIIWMDQRCLPQVDFLKKDFKELIWRLAFNPVNITYTLPKILWLQENEPDAWARLYKIQLPKDYVRLRLTGTWVMDHNDASGTLLLDVAKLCWSDEIIDALGFDRGRLPELLPSMAVAGNLTPEAARLLGLTAGIPVVAGAGDLAAENLAAGVTSSRQLLTRMGTAGSSSTCIEAPQHDPFGISPCYPHCIPKRWIAEIADHTFGLCERWFRDTFFAPERAQAEQAGTDFYAMMDAMAEAVPPGSEGLVFHPFNHGGPYWNPLLRGAFYGITLNHGKGHFFRSMLEGSTFCLKDSILLLRERIGRAPEEYRLVGGGTKSRLWTQMICDILGMNGHVLKTADASLGAAMMAGIGSGVFTGIEDAIDRCVVKEREVKFDPARGVVYDRYHRLYKLVHDGLMENSRVIQETLDRVS